MDAETSGEFCGLLLILTPIPSLCRLHVATIRTPDNLLSAFSTMRLCYPAKRNPILNFEDGDMIGRECRSGTNGSAGLSLRYSRH